jgi:hypothetical protein
MSARKAAIVIASVGSVGVPAAVLNLCAHLPRGTYAPKIFALKPEDESISGIHHRFSAAGVPVTVTVATATHGKIGTSGQFN